MHGVQTLQIHVLFETRNLLVCNLLRIVVIVLGFLEKIIRNVLALNLVKDVELLVHRGFPILVQALSIVPIIHMVQKEMVDLPRTKLVMFQQVSRLELDWEFPSHYYSSLYWLFLYSLFENMFKIAEVFIFIVHLKFQ